MRSQSGWSDACILNISSRGLLVYSKGAAQPGSVVQLSRGGHLIIARVVWRENRRMGLYAPDPLPVDEITNAETAAAAVEAVHANRPVHTHKDSHESSRGRSRMLQFASTALIGAALACVAALCVERALASPIATIGEALRSR